MKKKNGFMKRIFAFMLAFVLVTSSAAVTTIVTPQTTEANTVKIALAKGVLKFASKGIYTGLTKAMTGLDEDCPLVKVKDVIFFKYSKADKQKQQLLEYCQNMMNSVKEVDANVTATRNYLSSLIAQFSNNVNLQNLSAINQNMNVITAKTQTAWNAYLAYLTAVETYVNDATDENNSKAIAAYNNLCSKLSDIDFEVLMTTYIGYVSTELAHYEGSGVTNASKTYLYWANQYARESYAFDHQRYDFLTDVIDMNVGTLQQMMELHALYIVKLQDVHENGVTDASLDAAYDMSDAQYELELLEYEHCMAMGANACNNIAGQYEEDLDRMLQQRDLHTPYALDYSSEETMNYTYWITHAIVSDEEKSLSHKSQAVSSQVIMDFYRVGVDGETYLILNQKNQEVPASTLYEVFEADNPKALMGHLNVRAESVDWKNFSKTHDGKYVAVTSLAPIESMISPNLYAANGNHLVTYLASGGGLTDAGSDKTAYIFMPNKGKLIYDYNGEAFDWNPEVYMDATWSTVTPTLTEGNVFDGKSMITTSDFCNQSDKNVLIIMEEAQEDTVFEYYVNTYIQGKGTVSLSVDGTSIAGGSAVKPGTTIAITVKPESGQTLSALKFRGNYGFEEVLSNEGDFDFMQKNEDGSATYYVTMPYQTCEVHASFAEEATVESYSLTVTEHGDGDLTRVSTSLYDSEGKQFLRYETDTEYRVYYGEQLKLKIKSLPEKTYIEKIELTDKKGTVLQKLSALEETYFLMPAMDCDIHIYLKATEGGGSGTKEDPYLIPDYATLCKYGSATSGSEKEHYQNAHYLVTNDIERIGTDGVTYYLGENGVFDGQGYTLTQVKTSQGLFKENHGTIKNVVLNDITIDPMYNSMWTNGNSAALARINTGIIDNCVLENAMIKIDNKKSGSEYFDGKVGGLVYENNGGIIRNSGVMDTATVGARYVGGIAYKNYNGGKIENCFFSGTLWVRNPSHDEVGGAGGICYEGADATIDNCYVSGSVEPTFTLSADSACAPVFPTSLNLSAANCYVNKDAAGYTQGLVTGSSHRAAADMQKDGFLSELNSNLKSGYLTWVRSAEINSGFPVFKAAEYYYLFEEVTGAGSVVSSRENGKPISWTITKDETIHVAILPSDGIELKSLKVLNAKDRSVYKDFGATKESQVTFTMPNHDAIVAAEFTDWSTAYAIDTKVEGKGTVTVHDSYGKKVKTAIPGTTIYVKSVAEEGYILSGYELLDTSGNLITTLIGTETSFVMGSRDCIVSAKFVDADLLYPITTSTAGEGAGTIALSGTDGSSVAEGAKAYMNIQVTMTPDAKSYPSQIIVKDSAQNVIKDTSYTYKDYLTYKTLEGAYNATFAMPASACHVQVVYTPVPAVYKLNIEATGMGHVGVEQISGLFHDGAAEEGAKIKILATPDGEHVEIAGVFVYDANGTKISELAPDESYTPIANEQAYYFTMPAQDVTVIVRFSSDGELKDIDGDGYYEISCYEDLVTMAKMIQINPDMYQNAKYRQTNNINCYMKPWNLEIGTEEIPFGGVYEGYDYYILGLRPSNQVSGLFGTISVRGEVRNLLVVDFDYTEAPSMASGFVGRNYGTIKNCGSGVNLTSGGSTFLYGNSDPIPISSLDSKILATEIAGGLAADNQGTIINSRSSADVTIQKAGSSFTYAAGIAAVNSGTIKNAFQTGVIAGADYAGGIVAVNSGTIQFGYNNTAVSGTVAGSLVGSNTKTTLSDFWYADNMAKAAGDKEDSAFKGLTRMVRSEMATSAFKDTLNTAIAGQNLTPWTQKASGNEGFPRIESAVVVQRTLTPASDAETDVIRTSTVRLASSGTANPASGASTSTSIGANTVTRTTAAAVTNSSTFENLTISGRIHPDAKLMLVKLTSGDPEYAQLKGAIKEGRFAEGWKLALVYDDGTYAVWEGPLTIKLTPEQIAKLKELKMVYYDINGQHEFPNVRIEGDSLIIDVDQIGSFALVKANDIKNTTNGGSSGGGNGIKTGDAAQILPYAVLMLVSAMALTGVVVIKKKRGRIYE